MFDFGLVNLARVNISLDDHKKICFERESICISISGKCCVYRFGIIWSPCTSLTIKAILCPCEDD